MTLHQEILEKSENEVAFITLNIPEKHNALNDVIIKKLHHSIHKAIDNPEIKIIVLTANGEHFSSGADLNWMANQTHASLEENIEDAKSLANLMYALYHSPKPTIAAVHGSAFGGAIGLVAACHIVIAADTARFCFSEVKLGLIPAVISPYVINAIGVRNARYYYLTAQNFDAVKAKSLGLCHEVVSANNLQSSVDALINTLKRNGPKALRETNLYLKQFEAKQITQELANLTAEKIAKLRQSSEGQEGMKAFLEKRKPNWIK